MLHLWLSITVQAKVVLLVMAEFALVALTICRASCGSTSESECFCLSRCRNPLCSILEPKSNRIQRVAQSLVLPAATVSPETA